MLEIEFERGNMNVYVVLDGGNREGEDIISIHGLLKSARNQIKKLIEANTYRIYKEHSKDFW